MRVVCLSDTHNQHDRLEIPEGDLLIHAGDFSMMGREEEIRAFDAWLGRLSHRHKIVIAGNHDWMFEREPGRARALLTNATYLEDSEARAGGVRIWGSPWQPWFFDWAFNLSRGPRMAEKWAKIPEGVDILVTHGPPHGVLDEVRRGSVGCEDLLRALPRVRPRLHVFGHIHEGYGRAEAGDRIHVNASNCDADYRAVNPPIVIEL